MKSKKVVKTFHATNTPENLKEMRIAMDLSGELLQGIMDFVDGWLDERNMEVVRDEINEEPVVTNSGMSTGHGKITLSFHFKLKD